KYPYIFAGGGSIALNKNLTVSQKLINPNITIGVEADLGLRIKKLNAITVKCINSIVYTYVSSNLKEYFKHEIRWKKAHLHFNFNINEFSKNSVNTVKSYLNLFYPIVMAIFISLLLPISLVFLFFNNFLFLLTFFSWFIVYFWNYLRELNKVVNTYIRTKKKFYLKYLFSIFFLVYVNNLIHFIALLLYAKNKKLDTHFKGPRP
ncbi:MAG: hypothetical protein ACFFD2_02035, partial [Promethearchaeota archaeon]